MAIDLDALRKELARLGFNGWYGRDEYDEHPVQGMWERTANAQLAGPILSDLIAKAGRVDAAEKERDEARATNRDLHRRTQKAEQFRARHGSSFIHLIKRKLAAGRACRAALARATAAEAEIEGLRARQDAALRKALRNWSARLHIPVTRMMSRTLRGEFTAALAATQPDTTEAPASAGQDKTEGGADA